MSEMKQTTWHGCYRQGWGTFLPRDAFAHPAKGAYGLAERIYKHCIDAGYFKAGDIVLDPFGGIGGFAFHAMLNGLRWVGVELEEKFCRLGEANFAFWKRRWGLEGAVMIQGDSRRLGEVLREAGALVSSPPWAAQMNEGGCKGDPPNNVRRKWSEQHGRNPDAANNQQYYQSYGTTPGQLGSMPPGDIDAVISSPPYAESIQGAHGETETAADSLSKRQTEGGSLGQSQRHGGYGVSEGQLGAMKADGFEGVVSSPPYLNAQVQDGSGIDFSKTIGGGPNCQGKQSDYGTTEGNLGNLPAGQGPEGIVSSPPFQSSMVESGDPNYAHKFHGFQSEYGTTPGQLGNDSGTTFWSAARDILFQCHAVLRPGSYAVWVVKAYVRNGAIVDFPGQWRQLCEACGFETVEEIHASLTERDGHPGLFGEEVVKTKKRASFFRRLHEKKRPDLAIDHEIVWVTRKPVVPRSAD